MIISNQKWLKVSLAKCVLAGVMIVVALGIPKQSTAAGVDLSARHLMIMQAVTSNDGYITKDLHEEYWSSLPEQITENEETIRAFIGLMESTMVATIRFQRESWASAKLSFYARKVIKSDGYEAAKNASLNASSIPRLKQEVMDSIERSERLMSAAATGEAYQTPKGPIYITPEGIDIILMGFDGSIARFHRLNEPEWNPTVQEFQYPGAHVSILWETPFSSKSQNHAVENGLNVKVTTLKNQISASDTAIVLFNDFGELFPDPKGATILLAKAALGEVGADVTAVTSSLWRGRHSAYGTGHTKTSESVFYTSVRVVVIREYTGTLAFYAISGTSKLDADALLDSLERSTQVLR